MTTFNSSKLHAMRLRELALSIGIADVELSRAMDLFAKKGDLSVVIDLSKRAESARQYGRFWVLFRRAANKYHKEIRSRKDESE